MKTASSEFNTHLQGEVTSLTMCWKVKRTDGQKFHFTEHDKDLPIDIGDGDREQIYGAASSYNRSAISNDDSLAVDNLDLTGVLDSLEIDETELRRGLFDFAEIHVFIVNWKDLSQGILKMRKGWLGEVTITPNGFFQAELRGLTQALSRTIGDLYSPECRVDLGDTKCKIPILPEVAVRNKSYTLGDFVRAASELEGITDAVFLAPYDVDADDTSVNGADGTIGSAATFQLVEKKFGAGAMEFDYAGGAVDPSLSFVSYPDISNYTIGTSEFTIECWVRFKDLTEAVQVMMSHYNNTGNERAWYLARSSGNLIFFLSDDGTGLSPAVTLSGAFSWVIDTWYHIAVSRDSSDDVRLFVDGVQVGSTTSITFSVHDSSAPLRIGKFRSTGFDDRSLDGFIDDPRFVIGVAIYTAGFTPPSSAHQSPGGIIAGLFCPSFDDRIYICTTAGISAASQPVYDTTVDNTTTDGSAVFTAEEAWSRCITVDSVDPTNLRKNFTVLELTPNSGADTPGRANFPEDSMNGGVVVWETGDNSGTAMEIRNFVADDGITIEQDINLFLDLHFDIEIGDTARIYRGCFKSHINDCKNIFDNIVNFRGEPFVPGQDHLTLTPNAR